MKIADLCDRIDYGLTASADEKPVGPKFLRITDIVQDSFDWKTVPYVSIGAKDREKYALANGDIVIARTGATTGVSRYISSPPDCVFASYLIRIRAKTGVDPRYLGYLLKTSEYKAHIYAVAFEKAAQPNASAKVLTELDVNVLPEPEQRNVSAVLGALDDKIELNRRMNETLEEMARALFRDWFVDFGPTRRQIDGATDPAAIMGHAFPAEKAATLAPLFPAKLGDNGLPEGWRKGALQDFGTIKNGFAFKSKDWRDEGIPVVKIKNVKPRLVSLDGAAFIDPELAREKERFRLAAGDILVGMTGYVGEVGRVPDVKPLPMLNQRVGQIVAEYCEGFSPFLFAATRQPEFKEHAIARSHGSAQANVSSKDLGLFSLAKSCFETVREFDEVASPLFERMQIADTENQTLAEMRDLLLPKLMSGEIRLKDAEAMV